MEELIPSKSIRNHSTGEATEHAAYGEDTDSYRVQLVHRVFLDVLPVAVFVHVLHEVLYVLKQKHLRFNIA